MIWLAVLGILAWIFFAQRSLIPLSDSLGSVPLPVLWFGALGGVLISLTGVVEHAKDWDESYALWHFSRPVVGASLAVVAVLIVKAGVLSVGASPSGDAQLPKNLLYYLVAFLVGYREVTFRELIKRLVDLILAPATQSTTPTISGVVLGSSPSAGQVSVVISGSNLTGTNEVTFGASPAAFRVDSDSQITARLPTASAAGQVTVSLRGKNGSAAALSSFT